MNRMLGVIALVTAMASATAATSAIGRDFPKDELERIGQFVPGQIPVHGYFVNWEDVYFYSGDSKAFNRFMDVYKKFRHVQLKVVLHRGEGAASSPWDNEPRGIPADWSIYIWQTGSPLLGPDNLPKPPGNPAPTRVDVWVGKRLRLKDLTVPKNIEVAAAGKLEHEDQEIQRYLADRKPATTSAKSP